MQQITTALELLEQKKQLFCQYEEATSCLLTETDINTIEKYITEREGLANKIDGLDSRLATELAPWGAQAAALLKGQPQPVPLPEELEPLEELCGKILETVRRIRLKNNEAMARCEALLQGSEQQIRNARNTPKISRYLNNLTEPQNGNNFGSV